MTEHYFSPSDRGLHGAYYGRRKVLVTDIDHHYSNGAINITIPAGSQTDFASVPWPFTLLFPRVGPYALATLYHDELYRRTRGSRGVADSLLLELSKELGTPRWQRWPMYLAVRAFGWFYWNRNRRNRQESE